LQYLLNLLNELDRILPKLPASKKASKNNGQNWTVCCTVRNEKMIDPGA
jgi:hypothetical protein